MSVTLELYGHFRYSFDLGCISVFLKLEESAVAINDRHCRRPLERDWFIIATSGRQQESLQTHRNLKCVARRLHSVCTVLNRVIEPDYKCTYKGLGICTCIYISFHTSSRLPHTHTPALTPIPRLLITFHLSLWPTSQLASNSHLINFCLLISTSTSSSHLPSIALSHLIYLVCTSSHTHVNYM